MKMFTEYLWFETKKTKELVHITGELQTILGRSCVLDGLMLVTASHITAGSSKSRGNRP